MGKQREKMDGLTKGLNGGPVTDALQTVMYRHVQEVMITYAKEHGT